MPEIEETPLPGVGIRFDFVCRSGRRVGVIARTSGRKELVFYDQRDPDAVRASVDLSPEEAMVLGEVLGSSPITEQLDRLPSLVAGLAIDWVPIPHHAEVRTIGELQIRRRTGASVIAIMREDEPIPAPGPDTAIHPGDTVVLAGTAQNIADASARLTS